MSFLRSIVERRDLTSAWGWGEDPTRIPSPTEGWGSWAGVPVNEMRALQQLTVHACVALISDTVSTLPVGAFRKVDGFPRPVEPDPPLLASPHAELDWTDWIGRLLASLLLRGNAYGLVIDRDRYGFPLQIEPVHPDKIKPRRVDGRIRYRLGGEAETIPAFDVLHTKAMTLPGQLEGLDPVSYARQTIGTALAAEEFGARFFGDGGHPSGLLTSDQVLDEPTAKEFQARWMAAHGGRHRKPAVLGKGTTWEPISLKPEEAQFLQTHKMKRSEIAGFWRVPPHMIGDVERSTSWGTGIEEQMLGFVTFTLGIWIVRLERALSMLLPRPQYVKLNVAGLLRGRTLQRFQAYLIGRQGGWLNVDEIRAKEEDPPLPDGRGQSYAQPLNWGPIPKLPGMDEEEPEPPPPGAE